MNITQLHYFIVAAQTLNFTTAAERVFTTQPALSRQIAGLEEELGTRLFTRTNNVLELTDTGAHLYEKAVTVYEDYLALMKAAQDRKAGVEGRIRIGLLEDQIMDGRLTSAIHRLMQAHPRASIDIERHCYRDLTDHLEQGRLDVAQATIYEGLRNSYFMTRELSEEPLCLAVNRNYHTVARDSVPEEDIPRVLGECAVVAPSPESYPEVVQNCLPAMVMPNVRFVDTVSSIPLYLTTGLAASITNGNNLLRLDPSVKLIVIETAPPVVQGIIWSRNNTNPLLERLLELI